MLVFCLLLPVLAFCQSGIITGKVVQADTKAPIKASVFLANSSFGTSTTDDGTFTLTELKPGQYTLVVNALGYQSHSQTVLLNGKSVNLTIELSRKEIQLKEVSISTLSKADRELYYRQFKDQFIGTDKNAADCKIINPDILNISYHKAKKELDVNTDEFLIVENQALGYRIKFLIEEFKNDGIANTTAYTGQPLFEELPGSASQKKKWLKNRQDAYYGSPMHFYRSLYKDSLAANGFEIYRLTRELNPKPDPPKLSPGRYTILNEIDLRPRYINQSLDKKQWQPSDIFKRSNVPGIFAITFPNLLYVVYNKKKAEFSFKDVYHPAEIGNYPVTIISVSNNPPYALFDTNGNIVGDENPLYEGDWAISRLSQMLPVDYEPGK